MPALMAKRKKGQKLLSKNVFLGCGVHNLTENVKPLKLIIKFSKSTNENIETSKISAA